MKHRVLGSMVATAALAVAVSLIDAGSRRRSSPCGKPRESAASRRTAIRICRDIGLATQSGQRTASRMEGIQTPIPSRAGSEERNPTVIIDPPDGRIPYQPAAAARRNELLADIFTPTKPERVDPHVRATLDGVPRNNYVPGGMQIGQVRRKRDDSL